jgi:uncharacterized protein (UPF0332 family)
MRREDLLRTGRIRRETVSPAEIREALKLAARDLRLARKILREDVDWGFAVAYNAVLQASRAFMFAEGYRAVTAEGHKNTFAFLLAALGPEHEETITYFDRMRTKRNMAIYGIGMAGRLVESEARTLLAQAERFVRLIRARIQQRL